MPIATRPRGGFPALAPVTLEGVRVGTGGLTKEADRLESICRRIGMRLSHALELTKVERPMPSVEFMDAFRYYQAAVINLLREQRERARLTAGEHVSDEELAARFKAELCQALESFTPEEREYAMKLWERTKGEIAPGSCEVQ